MTSFRFISWKLHILDDGVPKLGAFDLVSAIHTIDDPIGHFRPAHITEHHLAGENHRTQVDLPDILFYAQTHSLLFVSDDPGFAFGHDLIAEFAFGHGTVPSLEGTVLATPI